MRPSRGMGCIKNEKLPKKLRRKDNPNEVDVYKKGGTPSIDRLSVASRASHRIGKQKPSQANLGNMSKFK